jgi:hypothetical protein
LGEEYISLSPSLWNFFHSPVTSSLLGPNILLNTLFSNTLSLRSSLNVSDQVSHPYNTTGNTQNISPHNRTVSRSPVCRLSLIVTINLFSCV